MTIEEKISYLREQLSKNDSSIYNQDLQLALEVIDLLLGGVA